MRRSRRVKIVATLGPASYAPEMIERLFEAGVDVFRINMSHSSFDLVKKLHAAVRIAEAHFGRPIGILADLQGPKFRVGEYRRRARRARPRAPPSASTPPRATAAAERVFLPHPQIFEAVEPGHTLLLDDGKIRMTRDRQERHPASMPPCWSAARWRAARASACPTPCCRSGRSPTRTRQDLDFALRLGVDWVALSFVQRGEDVQLARQIVGQAAALMAKIEKPAAIADLDAHRCHTPTD